MAAPARFAAKMTAGVFTQPVGGIRLPDRQYLVGEYLLGGTQAESIKNRANPALAMTVQGTPTYNAHSVIVRSHATAGFGFYTNIVADEEHTLIVVRKNPTVTSTPRIVGMASPVVGIWGPRVFTDNYFSLGETANNQGAHRTKPSSAAEVFFEAGVHSARNPQLLTGGLGTMYYYSGGVQQAVPSDTVATITRRDYRQYCIGTTDLTDSNATNNLEVFFVALYNKPLTAAGIDAAYQAIVAYYATVGVTVV